MPKSTLYHIINVSFWALLNALSLRLLNLISMYFAAKSLTPNDFGSLSLILNTAQTWSIFLGAGIGLTLSKYVSEYKTTSPSRAASLISTLSIFSALLGAIVLSFSTLFLSEISTYIFNGKLSNYDVLITAAWLLILTHQTAIQGAISGLEQFKNNALLSLFGGSVSLALIYAVAPHERTWILASLIFGNLITWILSTRLVFSKIKLWKNTGHGHFDKSHIGTVVKFGLPTFIGGLILSQSQWATNLELSKSGNGLAELASLNISLQWYAIILFVPGAISNAMLPLLSKLSNRVNEQLKLLYAVFFFNLTLSSAISVSAYFYSKDILLHYGNQYYSNLTTFRHLCIAAAVNGASSIFTQQIASLGKGFVMLYINIIWGITFLSITFIVSGEFIDSSSISKAYIYANSLQAIATIAMAYLLTRYRLLISTNYELTNKHKRKQLKLENAILNN